jgi:hypothetical protein
MCTDRNVNQDLAAVKSGNPGNFGRTAGGSGGLGGNQKTSFLMFKQRITAGLRALLSSGSSLKIPRVSVLSGFP